MKFSMNGSLIIGTLDGANVEILEEIGDDNMFVFGARADEVDGLRDKMRRGEIQRHARLNRVLAMIDKGVFGPPELFYPIIESIAGANDYYLVTADFPDYLRAQDEVDRVYQDRYEWNKRSILASVRCAKFSSDRTIAEYAEDIWKVGSIKKL
jgi:starch phosphorylase